MTTYAAFADGIEPLTILGLGYTERCARLDAADNGYPEHHIHELRVLPLDREAADRAWEDARIAGLRIVTVNGKEWIAFGAPQ